MELDPQLAAAFAVTTGIGFVMILSGLRKSMLEWRAPKRVCPSCGRRIEDHSCGCTRVPD